MISNNYKRLVPYTFFVLLSFQLTSQEVLKKYKYELGLGVSLLGTGDNTAISIVNEVDYMYSKRLEGSVSFVMGRGIPRYDFLPLFASSFLQLNANILFLPVNFKNKYKLKVGTGLSFFDINSVGTRVGYVDSNGTFIVLEYSFRDYSTLGYNLLIENEFHIYKNFSTSVLLMGQFYKSNDTNAGGVIKFGYSF